MTPIELWTIEGVSVGQDAPDIGPRVWNSRDPNVPKGAVYVGRPSKWGNPFVIGPDGTRAEVIAKYERWLLGHSDLVAWARADLRGHDLVCWCAPRACHGDVLLRVANE